MADGFWVRSFANGGIKVRVEVASFMGNKLIPHSVVFSAIPVAVVGFQVYHGEFAFGEDEALGSVFILGRAHSCTRPFFTRASCLLSF